MQAALLVRACWRIFNDDTVYICRTMPQGISGVRQCLGRMTYMQLLDASTCSKCVRADVRLHSAVNLCSACKHVC